MTIEGEIHVRLDWDGRRVHRVGLTSTRPFAASRVLVGRAPAHVPATAARLFSICAQSQGAAASAALAAAGEDASAFSPREVLERRVALETIHEYLWRLLIDLPKAMGGEPSFAPVATARSVIATATATDQPTHGERRTAAHMLERIVVEHVLGRSTRGWLALADAVALDDALARAATLPAKVLSQLIARTSALGASDVALMPRATPDALRDVIVPAFDASDNFSRAPHWNGEAVETGALARMHDHPCVASLVARHGRSVAARVAARMFELAALTDALSHDAIEQGSVQALPLGDGEGVAAVQTARGMLLHRVKVERGVVSDYRIVAPTEWNFHRDGPLVRGLDGHCASDRTTLMQDVRLAVQALDPCVGCKVEVGHA